MAEAWYVKTRKFDNEFVVRDFPDSHNQVPIYKRIKGESSWSRDDQSRTVGFDELDTVRRVYIEIPPEINNGPLPNGVTFAGKA